jgi:hypothetical protein
VVRRESTSFPKVINYSGYEPAPEPGGVFQLMSNQFPADKNLFKGHEKENGQYKKILPV